MRKPGAVRLLVFAQWRFEFFSSLFLSEAVCSTDDPISIFNKDLKVQMLYYKKSILDFLLSTVLYPKTVVKVDQKCPSARKWRSGGGRATAEGNRYTYIVIERAPRNVQIFPQQLEELF